MTVVQFVMSAENCSAENCSDQIIQNFSGPYSNILIYS
jgi:hypothetical protein